MNTAPPATEILDESDASGNFTNEYVFFGSRRIAMRAVSSGTIYYYAEDMLGSSRAMVQAGQMSLCYDADFLPFGKEVQVTSTCTQNYKFEGKERDTETSNDDFGARYFSYRIGRWLSADWSAIPVPVPYANLANPQTLNLYAMVSDNPESFADLDGHEPVSCVGSCTSLDPRGSSCSQDYIPIACSMVIGDFEAGGGVTEEEGNGQQDPVAEEAKPTAQNNNQSNEPVLIAQNQTPNPQQDQNKPQPNIPQEIKDIHSAFDKKVADMTANGERINNGPLNNIVSSVQRIGEALHLTHKHLCSCNEQAEIVSNSLNTSMRHTSYSFDMKQSWTHSWVVGTSSVKGAPVLVLDPWKNKFEVQPQ